MAFTRKFLSALGIEADKVDEIISAHSEVVDGLKSERDSYKAQVSEIDALKAENDDLKKQIEDKGNSDFEQKFNDLTKEFDDYKKAVDAEKVDNNKKSLYSQLLKESGVSDKRIESILRITDLSKLNLNEDGNFDNVDELKTSIKDEWKEFIEKPVVQGANPANPPSNRGSSNTMTKEQIMGIKDGAERRKAISENPELFGLKSE